MNPIANNQTKPNQTQTTPLGRGGVNRSRVQVTAVPESSSERKLPPPPESVKPDDRCAKVRAAVESRLLPGGLLWLGLVDFLGVHDGHLVIVGRADASGWVGRRYGDVIREAAKAEGFKGLMVCGVDR